MADFDAIVIGSGAGGLAAAVALANAGKKVLVLEQHYVPGGWCHTFQLSGHRFSPGVHYVGELGNGGHLRRIYRGLGVAGDMTFCELNPEGFDHVRVGAERFDIPKGRRRFAERLKERFPAEARGIDGYLDTVGALAGELDEASRMRGVLDVLRMPFKTPALTRWGFFSAKSLIDAHVRAPVLRAVLAAQSGDHGLPPSLAPAAVHAAVASHYFAGGYYPLGGAYSIPRAFLRGLRRQGGELCLRARVAEILVEGRRAVGVRLADGRTIGARTVVSNADPHATYLGMLGAERLSAGLRRRLSKTRYSVSALSLFMATDMDLRAAGLDSGNYWHYAHADVDAIYRQGLGASALELPEPPGLFLTATTLKDPSKGRGHHTLEAFAFVGYDAFKSWAASRYGDRPEDYRDLKRDLTARMLRGVDRILPGLSKSLTFCELGTPLTNAHFLAATRGNLYGTEKSLFQVGPWAYPVRTEIDGLLMCGASTVSHGVHGATVSGLAAASEALGCRPHELLTQKGPGPRIVPSEDPRSWPDDLKIRMPRAPAGA